MKYSALVLLPAVLAFTACSTLPGGGDSSGKGGVPYGAVAFSDETRRWAVVSDHGSPAVAGEKAIATCGAPDCRLLLGFDRGVCASFALDASRTIDKPFVASSTNANFVRQEAIETCSASGGQDCKASRPVCN